MCMPVVASSWKDCACSSLLARKSVNPLDAPNSIDTRIVWGFGWAFGLFSLWARYHRQLGQSRKTARMDSRNGFDCCSNLHSPYFVFPFCDCSGRKTENSMKQVITETAVLFVQSVSGHLQNGFRPGALTSRKNAKEAELTTIDGHDFHLHYQVAQASNKHSSCSS